MCECHINKTQCQPAFQHQTNALCLPLSISSISSMLLLAKVLLSDYWLQTSMWPGFMNKTLFDPWWKNIPLQSTILGACEMAPCWVCISATGSLVAWNRRWQAWSFTAWYFTSVSYAFGQGCASLSAVILLDSSRDFLSHSRIQWHARFVNVAFMQPYLDIVWHPNLYSQWLSIFIAPQSDSVKSVKVAYGVDAEVWEILSMETTR